MARIDLHLHTTYSDGSLPPAEVVALAHQAGVTAMAITDHDTVEGIPEARETATRLGIEMIAGIEISSRFGERELHILGYFLDWQDPTLQNRLTTLRESRHARNPRIIEKLNELGLDLTYEEVRALAGTDSVGRPHIARVLLEKRYVKTANEAFDRYLAEGALAYVPRELPEPAQAIAWIREAQGLPVLAHPSWLKPHQDGLSKLCETLKAEGLLGIEVYYSTHKPRQTSEYSQIAHRLDLLVTGGSDFHGLTRPDIKVGVGRGNLKVPDALLDPLRKAATLH